MVYEPQYDFVIDNPAILTVEVGKAKTEQLLEKSAPIVTTRSRQYLSVDELNRLLKHYDSLLQNMEQDGVVSEIESNSMDMSNAPHTPKTLPTIELAENTRQQLFDNVNQAFDVFLNYIQNQAKDYAKVLFKDKHFEPLLSSKNQLLQLLKIEMGSIEMNEWQRKLHELQSNVKILQIQDSEFKQQLENDLKHQSSSVASHIANAIDSDLDMSKKIILEDVSAMYRVQQYKNNLLKKMTTSYITFYSWMLEQWNRNIQQINQAYGRMYERIEKIWEKDQLNKDIEQLLTRYEAFLKAHESRLPMEFTLSINPRKEWREFMAKQQPEECIRFMKNELQALNSSEMSSEMKKSIEVWKHELQRYDVDKIHKLNRNRQQIRKRIEDAIEIETRETCVKRWKELTDRIYKMGCDLQTQAYLRVKDYDTQFSIQHEQLLNRYKLIQSNIASYEGRLALVDKPWATWMEKRKNIIRSIGQNNYFQVSIASLLEVYEIVNEFRQHIEKRQQAKME